LPSHVSVAYGRINAAVTLLVSRVLTSSARRITCNVIDLDDVTFSINSRNDSLPLSINF